MTIAPGTPLGVSSPLNVATGSLPSHALARLDQTSRNIPARLTGISMKRRGLLLQLVGPVLAPELCE